ncbi:MAG TPA: hypothetical protein VKT99_18060 [Xanthobacteraceae bacterium]|jgi:hypothetical protein|nr:hypothetical protein [Xanthobacteraceae bacterium]
MAMTESWIIWLILFSMAMIGVSFAESRRTAAGLLFCAALAGAITAGITAGDGRAVAFYLLALLVIMRLVALAALASYPVQASAAIAATIAKIKLSGLVHPVDNS